jgi:hypothetical protein
MVLAVSPSVGWWSSPHRKIPQGTLTALRFNNRSGVFFSPKNSSCIAVISSLSGHQGCLSAYGRSNEDNRMLTTLGRTGRESPKTIRLAIAERGHRHHNIWYVWSYKLRMPCVLPSDAALFHWALLEADTTVASYQLEAPSLVTGIRGEVVGTRFDAEVRFVDGTVTWDEVKWDIAGQDAARNAPAEGPQERGSNDAIQGRLGLRPMFWCLRYA